MNIYYLASLILFYCILDIKLKAIVKYVSQSKQQCNNTLPLFDNDVKEEFQLKWFESSNNAKNLANENESATQTTNQQDYIV